jgi:hypothetical protein
MTSQFIQCLITESTSHMPTGSSPAPSTALRPLSAHLTGPPDLLRARGTALPAALAQLAGGTLLLRKPAIHGLCKKECHGQWVWTQLGLGQQHCF